MNRHSIIAELVAQLSIILVMGVVLWPVIRVLLAWAVE
jgi:hypothetical protein